MMAVYSINYFSSHRPFNCSKCDKGPECPFLGLAMTPSLTGSCLSCARTTTLPHLEASLPLSRRRPETGFLCSDPRDWMLQVLVLHCPGNTIDPVSLIFPTDRSLFTSDTVLGQGTAVSEDLQGYTTRLQNVFDVRDTYDPLYPGHGPVVPDGPQTIRMYIDHRLEREAEILALLRTSPPDGSWTTWTITLKVYEGYPEEVLKAAARGIQLHMKKLEKEGRVRSLGGEMNDERWELVQ